MRRGTSRGGKMETYSAWLGSSRHSSGFTRGCCSLRILSLGPSILLAKEFSLQPDWTLGGPYWTSPPTSLPRLLIVRNPRPLCRPGSACREHGVLIASVLYVSNVGQGIRSSALLPVKWFLKKKECLNALLGQYLPTTTKRPEFKPLPCNWPLVPDLFRELHWDWPGSSSVNCHKERESDLQVWKSQLPNQACLTSELSPSPPDIPPETRVWTHPAGGWAFGQWNTIHISWFPNGALVWWIWFEHTDEIKQALQCSGDMALPPHLCGKQMTLNWFIVPLTQALNEPPLIISPDSSQPKS